MLHLQSIAIHTCSSCIARIAAVSLFRMDPKMKGIRLCLHFDINKTIIMSDVVSGRSIEETMNSLLSECTWGLCVDKPFEERSASDWIVCSDAPSSVSPMEGAITLGTYLEDLTPVPKKEQTKLKRSFANPGAIGERFQIFRDEVANALKLDSSVASNSLSYLQGGYYHIVPSFFRLIEYLAEHDIEFNLLFRTFGVDIENVCEEFNLFCMGLHPAYVPSRKLDGSDPLYRKDLRIKLPTYHGKFTHTGPGSEGLHMQYMSPEAEQRTVTGASEIYQVIMGDWFGITPNATVAHTHCAAVQDDFHWWRDHEESEHSGKLLLVDHQSLGGGGERQAAKEKVVQVFFDDNIERNRAHIVDVRDASTYAPVPFVQAQGRYLRRVEPYQAILDREYYVKEVQAVLALCAK